MGLRTALRALAGRTTATRTRSPETTMSLGHIIPSIRSLPPRRGTREFLEAYNSSPWMRAAVSKISQGIAHVPWELFVLRDGHRSQIPSHPLLDLLARGNDYMTGLEVRRVTQCHLELVGEAFWIIERDAYSLPQAILPVPPHWVLDVARPDRPYYTLQVPNGFHGQIQHEDVIWFRDPDPLRPYERGSGTAMTLGEELDADEAARRHIAAFLLNRARPDLVITGAKEQPLTRDDAARLEASWSQRHQGPDKSGRPLFLPGQITIQEIGHTPKDLELGQIRQQERDIIVSVFGIPPEKLGILTSSNRASIDAADLFFAKDVLVPRLSLMREVLQHRLTEIWGERNLLLDFRSPMNADKNFEHAVAQAAPWSRTVDEWRHLQGLPPLPNGSGHVFAIPKDIIFTATLPVCHPESAGEAENSCPGGKDCPAPDSKDCPPPDSFAPHSRA